MLVGKYIPNSVAKTFEVSRDYAALIYEQTSSLRLDKVLKRWDQDNWASAEQRQKLAYIILVELLAYWFASRCDGLRLKITFSKTLLSNDSSKLVPRRLSPAWLPELSRRSLKLKTILSLARHPLPRKVRQGNLLPV